MDEKEFIDLDPIIDLINAKINIPFLNEAQERLLIEAVLKMIIRTFPKKNSE